MSNETNDTDETTPLLDALVADPAAPMPPRARVVAHFPDYQVPDRELRELMHAAEMQTAFAAALKGAAEARRVRGVPSDDIELGIDHAMEVLGGINRAVIKRRRELAVAGGKLVR